MSDRGKVDLYCRWTSKDLAESFPKVSKPLPIGYFSLDVGRFYDNNASGLQYFAEPPANWFPLDLNPGLGKRIIKPESAYNELLDNILKYIYENPNGIINRNYSPDNPRKILTEFICFRGLLTTIMTTPYEKKNDWTIHVTRYKGNFYLNKPDTEKDLFERTHRTAEAELMCGYGFKFEQYCLRKKPDEIPNPNDNVDECSEFCCVFNTTIEDLSLLYVAEMDGIVSQNAIPVDFDASILEDLSFVELKTRYQGIERQEDYSFKRHISLKWWCQSYLAGISDLRVGNRDNSGKITRIDQYEIQALPKMCDGLWFPNVAANFLVKFLKMLKRFMSNVNNPYVVYEFHFHAESGQLYYRIIRGRSEHTILADWFIKFLDRI